MAVSQFPHIFYIKILNDTTERLGSIVVDNSQDLLYIVLSMITIGSPVGTERFRIKLFATDDIASTPIITGSWRNLSDFGSNKYGRLRFDFAQECLNKNLTYFVAIESSSYTKTGSFYVAVKLDWPDDVYTSSAVDTRGAQAAFIGYR